MYVALRIVFGVILCYSQRAMKQKSLRIFWTIVASIVILSMILMTFSFGY